MTTIASLLTVDRTNPKATGWTDIGTLTAITGIAGSPDGSGTSFSTTDADGGAICGSVAQATIPTTNIRYIAAAWVKKTTGTPSNYPAVGIVFGPAFSPSLYAAVEVDTTNGLILPVTGWFAPEVSAIQDWGDYWLVYVGYSNTTGETQVGIRLMPAWGAPPFNGGASSGIGGTTTWWYPFVQQGDVPVLPTVSNTTFWIADRRLTGIRSLATVDSGTAAVSVLRGLATLAINTHFGNFSVGASTSLTYQPGQLVYLSGALFAVGDDGALHKYSTALAETASVKVKATRPWIATAHGFVVSHHNKGEFAIHNTSLTLVKTIPSGLADIVAACGDSSGNLFLCDGRGYVAQFSIDGSGNPTFVGGSKVPNAVGVTACFLDGTTLVLSTTGNRVILVDTTTFAVTSSTTYVASKLNGLVLGDTAHNGLFENGNSAVVPDMDAPMSCGVLFASGIYVLGSSKASVAVMRIGS